MAAALQYARVKSRANIGTITFSKELSHYLIIFMTLRIL